MAESGYVLNIEGFDALRTSEAVEADLVARGQRMADAAGEGYRCQVSSGHTRARVTVWPDTAAAVRDEAEHNNLIRSLDAAR